MLVIPVRRPHWYSKRYPELLSRKFQVDVSRFLRTLRMKFMPQSLTGVSGNRRAMYGISASTVHPQSVICTALFQTEFKLKSSPLTVVFASACVPAAVIQKLKSLNPSLYGLMKNPNQSLFSL